MVRLGFPNCWKRQGSPHCAAITRPQASKAANLRFSLSKKTGYAECLWQADLSCWEFFQPQGQSSRRHSSWEAMTKLAMGSGGSAPTSCSGEKASLSAQTMRGSS